MTPARRLLSLLLLAGCSGADDASTSARSSTPIEPTAHDSAGVTVYELPADALERAPLVTMDARTIGTIGSDDPDDDVSRLQYFRFLPDGRVVGFDQRAGSVVVYRPDGAPVRRIGRQGEGPGEFEGADFLVRIADDTLAISDQSNGRVSLVAPDSGVIRSFPARMWSGAAGLAAGARLADGRWAMLPVAYAIDPSATSGRPLYPVLAVAESAGVDGPADTLDFLPGLAAVVTDGGTVGGKHRVSVSLGRFGELPGAQPFAGGFALVPGDAYRILVHGTDGTLRAVIRIDRRRIAVTDSMVEAGIRDDLERLSAPGTELPADRRDEAEKKLRGQPVADSLPPFGRGYSAGELLWLADYPNPTLADQGYTAFDRDGRVVGRLLLPRASRVEAFGVDRIILRTEDDDGIVRFEIHKLRMP